MPPLEKASARDGRPDHPPPEPRGSQADKGLAPQERAFLIGGQLSGIGINGFVEVVWSCCRAARTAAIACSSRLVGLSRVPKAGPSCGPSGRGSGSMCRTTDEDGASHLANHAHLLHP